MYRNKKKIDKKKTWDIVGVFVCFKGQQISKANYGFKTSSKKQTKLTILKGNYLKVNTKRESIFFLQEDRLSFVLTLK